MDNINNYLMQMIWYEYQWDTNKVDHNIDSQKQSHENTIKNVTRYTKSSINNAKTNQQLNMRFKF